jgi:hypothetical protein
MEILKKGPPFIDRDVFKGLMSAIPRIDGRPYEDIEVAYGDMSRLVVAWLARCTPDELTTLYNELGWKSSCSSRPIHEAAMLWMRKYRHAADSDVDESR